MKRGLKALDHILEPQEFLSRLIAFVEGEEGEDEGDDGTDTPPGGSDTGTTPPPPAGGNANTTPKPRVAETNQMVKERVNRDRLMRAKEAGFDSWDAMVAAAKKQQEADRANLSDLEKRNQDLTAANSRIAEVEQKNRSLSLRLHLTQHIAAEAPHLVGQDAEKWILPHLISEVTDEDYDDDKALAKKIAASVKEFLESVGAPKNTRVGTGGGPPRTTGGASNAYQESIRTHANGYLQNGAARFGARIVPRRE